MEHLAWALLMLWLCAAGAHSFSWGIDRRAQNGAGVRESRQAQAHQPEASYIRSQSPNMYALALNELQELESEPFCHRIAARLLVNNCQLLDGKDEATVHTDSGRAARDFVDFYAASLAICDLERGSFAIPPSCSSFRESTLAMLPVPTAPRLHVSTQQIDSCLEGLAQSDSAWNTWVSYRHKALRFCEAARIDNEKDQTIHMHQRVTKIMAKLATEVEAELETRLGALGHAFQSASDSLSSIAPRVEDLRSEVELLHGVLGEGVVPMAKQSSDTIRDGLDNAKTLRQLLFVLIEAAMDRSEELAASHETALQMATNRVDNEIGAMMAALTSVVDSSLSLQSQIEASNMRAAVVMEKQENLEMGMERLQLIAEGLSVQYDTHEGRLERAQQKAEEILSTLDIVSASAAKFRSSMSSNLGLTGWWPCILFPIVSLTMGSYGLEPSMGRNLWLVGIGEVTGFIVSSITRYASVFFSITERREQHHTQLNTTFDIETLPYENAFQRFHELRRNRYAQH